YCAGFPYTYHGGLTDRLPDRQADLVETQAIVGEERPLGEVRLHRTDPTGLHVSLDSKGQRPPSSRDDFLYRYGSVLHAAASDAVGPIGQMVPNGLNQPATGLCAFIHDWITYLSRRFRSDRGCGLARRRKAGLQMQVTCSERRNGCRRTTSGSAEPLKPNPARTPRQGLDREAWAAASPQLRPGGSTGSDDLSSVPLRLNSFRICLAAPEVAPQPPLPTPHDRYGR